MPNATSHWRWHKRGRRERSTSRQWAASARGTADQPSPHYLNVFTVEEYEATAVFPCRPWPSVLPKFRASLL
jgi:hypothetical protein